MQLTVVGKFIFTFHLATYKLRTLMQHQHPIGLLTDSHSSLGPEGSATLPELQHYCWSGHPLTVAAAALAWCYSRGAASRSRGEVQNKVEKSSN